MDRETTIFRTYYWVDIAMKVVIMNGSGGVGKDTFVEYMHEYLALRHVKMTHASIIDPIKKMAKPVEMFFGFDKDEKLRKFWSDLKILSDETYDYPFKKLMHSYKIFAEIEPAGVFVVDMREAKDIDRFITELTGKYYLTRGDICVLQIKNGRVPKIESNIADAQVDTIVYDETIYNDADLDNLRNEAHKFVIDFIF